MQMWQYRVQLVILMALLFIHLAILCWDGYAMFSGLEDLTISSVVRGWARRYPVVPLLVGILLGHLFF